MSFLTNALSKFNVTSPSCLLGVGQNSLTEILLRNASKKAGASTRNKCRNTPGKRRGIKIYDGQRIPHG